MLELFKANTEYIFDSEKIKVGSIVALRRIATDGTFDESFSWDRVPLLNALVTAVDRENIRILTPYGEYVDIISACVVDSPSFDPTIGIIVKIYAVTDSIYTGE